jgi:hypothetical protein
MSRKGIIVEAVRDQRFDRDLPSMFCYLCFCQLPCYVLPIFEGVDDEFAIL